MDEQLSFPFPPMTDPDEPQSTKTPYWHGKLSHREGLLFKFLTICAIFAFMLVCLVIFLGQ